METKDSQAAKPGDAGISNREILIAVLFANCYALLIFWGDRWLGHRTVYGSYYIMSVMLGFMIPSYKPRTPVIRSVAAAALYFVVPFYLESHGNGLGWASLNTGLMLTFITVIALIRMVRRKRDNENPKKPETTT